jgi:RNA polymerase sigma-70 factor, ECF subfamily
MPIIDSNTTLEDDFLAEDSESILGEDELRARHADFQKEALPHLDALYNFALRMTADPDDADDLVQETFLKAYRFFDKFEKGTNCKAWLFRIMKNSFINIYRKTSKEPDKVDYDDVEEFYHVIRAESTDSNDLQEKLFSNVLDDDVTRALESLPEEFRTVVILCDIEGFTYEEIADFVECPIGTVRSRLHRGRKMLRTKLLDYARKRGYPTDETTDD